MAKKLPASAGTPHHGLRWGPRPPFTLALRALAIFSPVNPGSATVLYRPMPVRRDDYVEYWLTRRYCSFLSQCCSNTVLMACVVWLWDISCTDIIQPRPTEAPPRAMRYHHILIIIAICAVSYCAGAYISRCFSLQCSWIQFVQLAV